MIFFYDTGDNNVFGLIQPAPDSEDTLEAYIIDEDVVDTMVDYMLESMEQKKLIYVMNLILSVGRNIKLIITLTLCLIPLGKKI